MTSATSADELKIQIDRQQLKIWKMKNPEKAPPRLVCAVHRRQKCTPVIPKAGGNLLPNFGVVPQKTTYSRASLVTVGAACASFLIKVLQIRTLPYLETGLKVEVNMLQYIVPLLKVHQCKLHGTGQAAQATSRPDFLFTLQMCCK